MDNAICVISGCGRQGDLDEYLCELCGEAACRIHHSRCSLCRTTRCDSCVQTSPTPWVCAIKGCPRALCDAHPDRHCEICGEGRFCDKHLTIWRSPRACRICMGFSDYLRAPPEPGAASGAPPSPPPRASPTAILRRLRSSSGGGSLRVKRAGQRGAAALQRYASFVVSRSDG